LATFAVVLDVKVVGNVGSWIAAHSCERGHDATVVGGGRAEFGRLEKFVKGFWDGGHFFKTGDMLLLAN